MTDLDAALAELPDPVMRRRVRHVVTENARVVDAAKTLQAGRLADVAPLLDVRTSMRDDFEITVPTVDLAVETARRAGALGARMTGGGFGGCILALIPPAISVASSTKSRPPSRTRGSEPPLAVHRRSVCWRRTIAVTSSLSSCNQVPNASDPLRRVLTVSEFRNRM